MSGCGYVILGIHIRVTILGLSSRDFVGVGLLIKHLNQVICLLKLALHLLDMLEQGKLTVISLSYSGLKLTISDL